MSNKDINIDKLDFKTIEHEKVPFTLIHTKVIQTITDHFAGFIWVYLHSLPSNWKINKTHLQNHFDIGENKLKKHMAYLSKTNLIEYVQKRSASGQTGDLTIRVLNGINFNPQGNKAGGIKFIPPVITAGMVIRPAADGTCGFYPPTNTIDITNDNKENTNTPSAVSVLNSREYPDTLYGQVSDSKLPQVFESNPFHIPDDLLQDWIIIRKQKRQAITVTAWSGLNKELAKCYEKGIDVVEAFEEMVNRGWSTLKTDWIEQKKSHFDNNSTAWAKGIEKDLF